VRKPLPLRPKDKVHIVAPAGPFDRASFEAGLALIAARYQPSFDEGLFSNHRYLAGDDARRLKELSEAFSDPQSRAVFCARGGYGTLRLLPHLRENTRAAPKLLVGFSDITALHALQQSRDIPSLHAPVLTQLGKQPQASIERLWALLESTAPAPALSGAGTYVPGTAEGRLVGGNLSVFTRLLGTPYLPPLQGSILFLEDVTERPYRIDRMWQHLALAGVFEKISGIALGEFTKCDEPDGSHTSGDVLHELAQQAGLPCAFGFPVGHGDLNLALPLGCRARLSATDARLEFLEAPVEEAKR
jgi:muramoyltetrapeptide carboxypeptidase